MKQKWIFANGDSHTVATNPNGPYWGADANQAYAKLVQKRLDFNQIL
jgi:hypothetical protein